jgi:hypothetical protein
MHSIGGAGLGVTDPEPLPDGQVARFVAGEKLAARIDPVRGY